MTQKIDSNIRKRFQTIHLVKICCFICLFIFINAGILPYQSLAQSPTKQSQNVKVFYGKSIKVDDGDTFVLLTDKKQQIKIRLYGIDAPEKGMAFARKSKEYLADLLKDKRLKVIVTETDQYGRSIAKVYVEQQYINLAMIAAGLAWHFTKYSQDFSLTNAEQIARKNKLGLWQDKSPLAPWTVRAYRRAGYSDKAFNTLRKENNLEIERF